MDQLLYCKITNPGVAARIPLFILPVQCTVAAGAAHRARHPPPRPCAQCVPLAAAAVGRCGVEFLNKRGSYRDTWHPTLRALGVAAMRR
eukprot:4433487-Prymnesium_polylepis.1